MLETWGSPQAHTPLPLPAGHTQMPPGLLNGDRLASSGVSTPHAVTLTQRTVIVRCGCALSKERQRGCSEHLFAVRTSIFGWRDGSARVV